MRAPMRTAQGRAPHQTSKTLTVPQSAHTRVRRGVTSVSDSLPPGASAAILRSVFAS
jgi:hypothetical protein